MAYKQNWNIGTKKYLVLFFILFGLVFVRYCYFGFEYFYQLDDYIQYHNYTEFSENLGKLIVDLGMLSSRPLAGIFDLFVWSHLYEVMLLAALVISAMYAASAIFLHKVFSKYFGTGYFFFVIFALLPTGFEGAYWVSASSRIIVGLFFASLSLLYFDKWCASGNKSSLISFSLLQFVCFCFYEQVLVFSAAATLVLMLLNKKARNKRSLYGLLMFANALLYYIITWLAPDGVYGGRTSFFLPWQEGYFSSLFLPLTAQLTELFTTGTSGIYGKGLLRGFRFLFTEPNIIWFIIAVLLCSALFLVARGDRRKEFRLLSQSMAGLFLAAAPILLFFIIDSPWFGLRNLVTSFCGFALLSSALLDLLCCRMKKGAVVEAAIISVAAFLCCIASVSELHDYRQTTVADTEISKAAYEAVAGLVPAEGEQIWLLNVDASYVTDGNFYYHEHNYGVTGSNWALTGAVRAIGNDGSVTMLEPVSVHRTMPVSGAESLEDVRAFFYKGGEFIPVSLVAQGNYEWKAISGSGVELGYLRFGGGGVRLTVG